MPIIRRKLDMNEVYPTTQRYNAETDTVQSFVNGSWVDNPQVDPRTQTLFPPRVTNDTKCDAAQSVADAFKNTIDETLTLIGESKKFFSVASAILALFEFGPFGLFIVLAIALANAMLDAGTIALEAALTDPVWHTFMCILDCHMDSDGRLIVGSLALVEARVNIEIGGLAATVLNSMLQISGEGGVNNLASLGTSTGDCSDCGCGWCYEIFFNDTGIIGDGGWTPFSLGATFESNVGWNSVSGAGGQVVYIEIALTSCVVSGVSWGATPIAPTPNGFIKYGTVDYEWTSPQSGASTETSEGVTNIQIAIGNGGGGATFIVQSIIISGNGTAPPELTGDTEYHFCA